MLLGGILRPRPPALPVCQSPSCLVPRAAYNASGPKLRRLGRDTAHTMVDHNPMEIEVRDQGDISIVDVRGRLAIGESAEQLHEALNTIVRRGVRKVVVILNHVTQIDSSGISTLVRVAIGLAREKGSLHLVCGPGRVRDSLTVTRLVDAIPTFESEGQALAKF
jgi:anti-anti-sigma factor